MLDLIYIALLDHIENEEDKEDGYYMGNDTARTDYSTGK